ncbi:hypothetical protein IAU60_005266 [Kwoniella sp. DSM 27419]
MTRLLVALCALLTLSAFLTNVQAVAGPHAHAGRLSAAGGRAHRRHHARAAAAQAVDVDDGTIIVPPVARRDSCVFGSWKCFGTELQRCYNDRWNFVQNCTGENIVCSDALYTTGCVWTWSVQPESESSESSESLAGPTDSVTASSVVESTTSAVSAAESSTVINLPSLTASVTVSPTAANLAASPVASADASDDSDDNDDDGEDTEDYEDDNEDDDLDQCDEYDASTTAAYPSPTVTTAAPSSTSVIGGQLWAGQTSDSGDSDDTATETSTYDDGSWHSDDGHDDGQWHSSTDDAWDSAIATSTSTRGWYGHGGKSTSTHDWAITATATTASEDNWTAGVSATASSDGSSGANDVSTSSRHRGHTRTTQWGQQTATATESSSTAEATTSGSASNKTSSHHSAGSFSAPHYVIYADNWLTEMPSVSDLSSYNRFILAFWMTNQGAVDDAQFWEQLDSATRNQVIQEYHEAGIALMVSAFGSTDSPTSNGADATQTAQDLAAWVKQYGLDGVDIDYEDMSAMNNAQAVAWIVEFQSELRRLLPSPYIISHAPVAPWFTSARDYSDDAYVAIHKQVGDGIDFYNVQFYNQGDGVYTTCETLLFDSGNDWPSTSVFELNSYAGVPLDKIVIGKPLDEGAAANGFMDASVLTDCVTQAQQKGWNGGVMFWEWTSSAPSIMATVRGTQ